MYTTEKLSNNLSANEMVKKYQSSIKCIHILITYFSQTDGKKYFFGKKYKLFEIYKKYWFPINITYGNEYYLTSIQRKTANFRII